MTREKYSEMKLQANFLQASPAYLTTLPLNGTFGVYTNTSDLVVTPLIGQNSSTDFYIVRHSDYTSLASTSYTLNLATSIGTSSSGTQMI